MHESMGDMSEALTKHLKKYMAEHNLTQNELARKLPMSESGFSNIVSGKVKHPQDDILEKIADATGITYLEIKAMLDPRLAKDWEASTRQLTYSAKARLLAEEFDKLPAGTQEALLALVLSYKP